MPRLAMRDLLTAMTQTAQRLLIKTGISQIRLLLRIKHYIRLIIDVSAKRRGRYSRPWLRKTNDTRKTSIGRIKPFAGRLGNGQLSIDVSAGRRYEYSLFVQQRKVAAQRLRSRNLLRPNGGGCLDRIRVLIAIPMNNEAPV
jgi:hypothetical protein